MANLKLNNVVVVTESAGTATVQSGIFKAKDGTAAFTIADSTGAVALSSTLAVTGAATLSSTLAVTGASTFTGAVTVPTATASGHAVTKAQLDAQGIDGITSTGSSASDTVTVAGHLTVNGTTTTINSTTLSVDDKNIEMGSVATPSDTTADGGGLTLKGATDKTISWVNATDAWTFNQHLFPSADNASDLGSTAKRWRNIYTTDLHLANERGNWTVIEEEDYLTLRNNKTDKVYKLVMEEIE